MRCAVRIVIEEGRTWMAASARRSAVAEFASDSSEDRDSWRSALATLRSAASSAAFVAASPDLTASSSLYSIVSNLSGQSDRGAHTYTHAHML